MPVSALISFSTIFEALRLRNLIYNISTFFYSLSILLFSLFSYLLCRFCLSLYLFRFNYLSIIFFCYYLPFSSLVWYVVCRSRETMLYPIQDAGLGTFFIRNHHAERFHPPFTPLILSNEKSEANTPWHGLRCKNYQKETKYNLWLS